MFEGVGEGNERGSWDLEMETKFGCICSFSLKTLSSVSLCLHVCTLMWLCVSCVLLCLWFKWKYVLNMCDFVWVFVLYVCVSL